MTTVRQMNAAGPDVNDLTPEDLDALVLACLRQHKPMSLARICTVLTAGPLQGNQTYAVRRSVSECLDRLYVEGRVSSRTGPSGALLWRALYVDDDVQERINKVAASNGGTLITVTSVEPDPVVTVTQRLSVIERILED